MKLLKDLINPLDIGLFFEEYWTKSELLLNGCFKSDQLFSLEEFNSLLNVHQSHLGFPTVRLIKNGKVIADSKFTEQTIKKNQLSKCISLKKIAELCENGATLSLNGLNEYSEKLNNYCNLLSNEIQESTQINAYLSQKDAQGFDAHYDHHEIFIIQIAGQKEWTLFGKADTYPLPVLSYYDQGTPNRLDKRTFSLRPGDVLYIPRGMWHEAIATNQSSFHLTLNVKCALKIDLIKLLVERLGENDVELRKNLFDKTKISNENTFKFVSDYLAINENVNLIIEKLKHKTKIDTFIKLPFNQ